MHSLFLMLRFNLDLFLAGALWILGVDRLAVGTMVSLDWNQIIMGLIGLISAYIAYRSHALGRKVDVVSTDVVAVSKDLKDTKHEINSQMTEALKVAVAKGVLEGIELERQRKDIEDANKAKGVEVGRQAERELEVARKTPVDDPKTKG